MLDGVLLVRVWLVAMIFQLAWAPVVILATRRWLVDGGWMFARLFGWLAIGCAVWWLAHFGLAVNTQVGVLVTAIGLSTAVAIGGWHRLLPVWRTWWARSGWLVIIEELLFLAGIIWMAWVRQNNPDILDLEKFMDAGLMVAYTQSPVLPAVDMWLAGKTINYYTFGHFGCWARI